MNNKAKKIFLLIGDIIILYVSLYFTFLLRYQELPNNFIWQKHFQPFTIIFIAWIIIFYISDLYNLHLAVNNSEFFKRTISSIAIAGLISAVYFYIDTDIGIAPKTNLIIYIFVFYFLFFFWRRLYNYFLHSFLPKNNIAFIGYNKLAKELTSVLETKPHLGYRVNLIVHNDGDEKIDQKIIVIDNVNDLEKKLIEQKISTVILATDPHQSPDLRTSLFNCLPLKINITSLSNFYEMVTGKIPLDAINQMWFLENLSEGNKGFFDAIKRFYDIILGFFILLLTIILWPIIGLIIKLESAGSIFFKQIRLGKDNKNFTIIKFRTMKTIGNDQSPTKNNDERITAFGNFLRKSRIDEIPQILNIIKGDMSFVGPRPERPELIKELEEKIPYYKERLLVKPGLTGWDQISGEYHSPSYEDTIKKLQYDLFYIKNRSLYLDLTIILKTIATVFSRAGL